MFKLSYIITFLQISLLSLLLAELAFQFTIPLPEVTNFNRINYSKRLLRERFEQPDSLTLSRASFNWPSKPDGVINTHYLNLYGFRDIEWDLKKKPDVKRIAFVGDSFVEGFMTSNQNTMPAVFRSRIEESDNKLEVFNLGIGGASMKDYMLLLRDFTPLFKPDIVVLVLYANDFRPAKNKFEEIDWSQNLTPKFRNEYSLRLPLIVSSILKGHRLPLLWHDRPFNFLDPVPSPRNSWSKESNEKKFLEFVDPEIAAAMKAGQFNHYVVNRANRFRKVFLNPASMGSHLLSLKNFLNKSNVSLHVVYVPNMLQLSDYYLEFQAKFAKKPLKSSTSKAYQRQAELLMKDCEEQQIHCLDLTKELLSHEKRGEHLYWEYDSHMNKDGYRVMADAIYKWLLEADILTMKHS